ncbi:MAG: heme o synthase [Myxococcales bacterium]|nr:heme o synthase [Myxococcales bacterium]
MDSLQPNSADHAAAFEARQVPDEATGPLAQLRGYWQMTRPSVVALVFFTAVPMMFMVPGGLPPMPIAIGLLAGIAAIAGASSVFNAWIERESDKNMVRTRTRPLPSGLIAPNHALAYAWLLTFVGLAIIGACGQWQGVLAGALTIAFYVFVYTIWLKPRTPLNIVIGGAAGAAPPMIVDAALTGQIGLMSFTLFAIVFLWTPPHFWAISLFRKDDYAAAGFPMLPITHGDEHTRRRITLYALTMAPPSLLPVLTGHLSMGYGGVALAINAWFIWTCWQLERKKTNKAARTVMFGSLIYLHLLFTAMTVDLLF